MKKHWCLGIVLACAVLAYAPVFGQQTATPNPVIVPGTVPTVAPGVPSQNAVAVTTVPTPASPNHLPDQLVWALAMSYAMRFFVTKGWLGFTAETSKRMKVICGGVLALATAAGIHFGVEGTLLDGAHGATVTITGLSFNAFKDIGFQWVSQQAWYDGLVKKVA